MTGYNTYLTQDAAVVQSPITFTTTLGAADAAAAMPIVRANIDLILDLVKMEEADASVKRYYLDEMSPACRIILFKILTDLKTASPNIA